MKPVAWRHMMMWGTGSGFVLGGLFMLLIFLNLFNIGEAFKIGFPFVVVSAHMTAVAGMFLGILTGFVVEYSLPYATSDFDKAKQIRQARVTLPLVFMATALLSIPAFSLIGDLFYELMFPEMRQLFAESLLVQWTPPVVAGIASMYAAYRYLFRLRLYNVPPRKLKDVARKIKKHESQEVAAIEDYLWSKQDHSTRSNHHE